MVSAKDDVTILPPVGGVYFHPQVLTLGVKLPMTPFVRDVLAHLKVPYSQLTPEACQTVLGFEAFYATYAPVLYGVEE